MQISLDDLVDALEFVSAGQPMEHEAYLCVSTGTIHYHTELGDDEEPLPDDVWDTAKYIPIPHKNDLGLGKRLAVTFAGRALPDALDEVQDIFRRKGAYGRFKNLLERRDLVQRWYEFEAAMQKEALRQWHEDSRIEFRGDH